MENDLNDLWDSMPEEIRDKINKFPSGIRDSYIEFAKSYALSAYKLGARRERRNCQRAILKLGEMFNPDKDLNDFLDPPLYPRA